MKVWLKKLIFVLCLLTFAGAPAFGQSRTASNNLDEKKKRVRDNIINDIRNIASAKAKEKGVSLVVDTAAETVNGTPVILFSNNELDLTDAVLSQLNAGAPAQNA